LTQFAVAWILHKRKSLGINIIPIIGVSSQDHLLEDLQAHTRETRGFIGERLEVDKAFLLSNQCVPFLPSSGENFSESYQLLPPSSWGWHAPVLSRERIHQMDNVIVSPDRSCAVKELENQMIDTAVANVVAFATGKKWLSQVNL
jgi:hypothetical protein